jgi:hypothetical protein
MAQAIPWISLALTAVSSAANWYQTKSSGRKARHAQEAAMARWKDVAYPEKKAVAATERQQLDKLAQARSLSYQNLATNLAARGFGSGSGLGVGDAKDIESGYAKALGQSATELTKFKHTPLFQPPSQAYPSYTAGENPYGSLQSAAGYYSMMNMLNNGGTTDITSTGSGTVTPISQWW